MSSCCSIEKNTPPVEDVSKKGLMAYWPLIVMVLTVLVGSVALAYGLGTPWMPIFMGLFLLNFAMFKLFDIAGFANSFAMYDIIGARCGLYAKAYPFIELALALGFLFQRHLDIVYGLTALVMGVGLIGIINQYRSGQQVRCACMGNLINVPVGSVTVLENTSMIVMTIWYFLPFSYLSVWFIDIVIDKPFLS